MDVVKQRTMTVQRYGDPSPSLHQSELISPQKGSDSEDLPQENHAPGMVRGFNSTSIDDPATLRKAEEGYEEFLRRQRVGQDVAPQLQKSNQELEDIESGQQLESTNIDTLLGAAATIEHRPQMPAPPPVIPNQHATGLQVLGSAAQYTQPLRRSNRPRTPSTRARGHRPILPHPATQQLAHSQAMVQAPLTAPQQPRRLLPAFKPGSQMPPPPRQ